MGAFLSRYPDSVENSLKPQPLIAEVLPGLTTLFILVCAYFVAHPETFTCVMNRKDTATVISGGFTVILASWIVGTILDAVRDLIEHVSDRCAADKNLRFRAMRDIKAGEELYSNYDEYSE